MVHALEIVHNLLEQDGLLIDIHPTGEPPPIEVVYGGRRSLAGYLQESDGFSEYARADEALAESVAMGLFDLERQGLFEFFTQAATLTDLLAYLDESWSDAIVSPDVHQRAVSLLAEAAGAGASQEASLVMTERVRILRLRSVRMS